MIPDEMEPTASNSRNADDLMVVDCLLPGQVRQLGLNFTFMAPRPAIKTTSFDCALRGGEFTAYDRANYQTALKVWLPQAEKGDPEAQTYVGEIYEKGLGTTPHYATAAKWYAKAAKQGLKRAQINLGYLYEKGLGVKKDLPRALNFYRDASGLQNDDDLAFASTVEIETQKRVVEVQRQVDSLQHALDRSLAEATSLRKRLDTYKTNIEGERYRLNRALDELDRAHRKLEVMKSVPEGKRKPAQMMKYKRDYEKVHATVLAERRQMRELERKYQAESKYLNSALSEAEKKISNYESKLSQSRQSNDSLNKQLAQSEAQLAILRKELAAKQRFADATRQQQLESIQREFAEQEKQITKKNREALDLVRQVADLNQEKQVLENRIQNKQSINTEQLSTVIHQLILAQDKLADKNQLIEKLESEKERLTTEQARLEATQDLALKEKGAEIEALKNAIEEEKKRYQDLVEQQDRKANTFASLEPPSIELIDPPLSAIRGSSLGFKLRSPVGFRDITGSAVAPAGILSLTVNDESINPSDTGLFLSRIQLARRENPVNVTLVDRNGLEAHLNFKIIKPKNAGFDPVAPPIPKKLIDIARGVKFGPYYALLIGNEKYSHLPQLNTPIDDVTEIDNLLRNKYNFNTKVLINADRYALISALNELRERLTENDNLLIYYAGHGEIDEVNQLGQWLPVDAEMDNNANWIPTRQVTEIINTMSVKHILVVADSCYSGSMTRASVGRLDTGMSSEKKIKWLKAMVDAKSRTVLSSGGVEPVLDSGGGEHSIFANAFINALQRNTDILEAQSLYRIVNHQVREASEKVDFEQSPLYGPIRHTGHETGDFFFVPSV